MNPLLTRLRQEADRLGVRREFDALVAQYPQDANGTGRQSATFQVTCSWHAGNFGSAEQLAQAIEAEATNAGLEDVSVTVS